MSIERTLSIIKPDATRRNLTGLINARFEEAGLRITAQRRIRLTLTQAQGQKDWKILYLSTVRIAGGDDQKQFFKR